MRHNPGEKGRDDWLSTEYVMKISDIRVNKPSLNRDLGRYQLPSVWNNILNKRVTGGGGGGVQVLSLWTVISGQATYLHL